jgi:hypothetical protein
MEYIIRIKPIEAFGTLATRLHVRLFYVLYGTTQNCFIEYKTFDGQMMYAKNMTIPEEIISKWGVNDDLILQYIVKAENVTIDDSPVYMVDEQAQLQTKEKLATPTEVDYQSTEEIVAEALADETSVPPLTAEG